MLPWMPKNAAKNLPRIGSPLPVFSSRRRARNRAAVSGARIKSSVANQVPCELALVKLLSPFPPQCPARPPTPFTRRLPSSRLGLRSARDREPARARGSTRHTRGSDTPRAAGTTAQLYTYIRARPYVLVGATFCISLSLLCGRGNAQSSTLALRKGLSPGTCTPKRKEAHVDDCQMKTLT